MTTARTVQHPITMFITAVLVVIAISVGIVAVTQTAKVYGPSWGRFTAAFPGRVCSPRLPIRPRLTFHYENASSYTSKCPIGWTGYAPLASPLELDSVDVYGHVETGSEMQGLMRLTTRLMFHAGVTEAVRSANGITVTNLGPQCSGDGCTAVEYVSNGRVLWTLTAISPGSVSTIESFLASFGPIG